MEGALETAFVSTGLLPLSSRPVVPHSLRPLDCSTPGFPVPHHLPEFAQVHVHCISDAVQPSHPLMLSSPSALSLSQNRGLSQWVVCSNQVTKILELHLQHQSFQWRVNLQNSHLIKGKLIVLPGVPINISSQLRAQNITINSTWLLSHWICTGQSLHIILKFRIERIKIR